MESIETLRRLADNVRNGNCDTSRAIVAQCITANADAIEREIAEKYMPLPVDAAGIAWKYDDGWFVDPYECKCQLEGMKIERDGEWFLRSPLG